MRIAQAELNEFSFVKRITQETINAVYPRYYPAGAVEFFLQHHCDDNIINDIKHGKVYILQNDFDEYVGTVTVDENEIHRLFVLPEFQHQGYGRALMDHAEIVIAQNYNEVLIDASLPAKGIYRKRGYVETDYHTIIADNGDYLCYDVMRKEV
jgi:GNAT superfamily N-acetyltransferase